MNREFWKDVMYVVTVMVVLKLICFIVMIAVAVLVAKIK